MTVGKANPSDAELNPVFSDIKDVIADIRAGRMVIIVDDEDRENEGDLIMAAEAVQPEHVNFMAKFGRGLICLTLTRDRCKQLRLPLMVTETDELHATNFTLSIEAVEGVTTGISAHDRARTIQAATAKDAKPEDLCQPGHVFPLMAQPGGVLNRAGHTEAGCDLARMAGFEPASVIVEILNEDGSMARRPELEVFAREHDLKIGSIADLIRYRLANERSVERIADLSVQTEFGEFRLCCFEDHISSNVHTALIKGEPDSAEAPLVRVHVQETLGDVLGVQDRRLGRSLRSALERISQENNGIVVVLHYPEDPRHLVSQVRSLGKRADQPARPKVGDTVLRTYGIGSQILSDLGVTKMRVLSAPKQMNAISGFGLEIIEYVDEL
ncbi:MAG: 3,4-dihydroxy-2-butanone-4-phosphate synthase [Gammaproteobacteria bacterium]|nr:3,4-dihydroxy-2-butanone-4-phosphate synthase [Gammaproteobacteria bacterium]NND53652.1 3,4-dihydroxy-2-butanone-4-phosphate synthase [Gammaproteobacteria bacterium]